MKEIVVRKDICERIRNAKDLSDFYACCERFEDDFTYFFATSEEEQNRIDELVEDINYEAGVYDEENVKRILGGNEL